jgi:hypothetical protein
VRRARTRATPTPRAVVFSETLRRGRERGIRSEDDEFFACEALSQSAVHVSCTWLKAAAVRSASSPR